MVEQSVKSLQIQYVELSLHTKKNLDLLVKSINVRVCQHVKKVHQASKASIFHSMDPLNSDNSKLHHSPQGNIHHDSDDEDEDEDEDKDNLS